jgi:NIF3 (NGG1p interacting factor 3)
MIPRSLLLSGLLAVSTSAAGEAPQAAAAPPPLTARQVVQRIQEHTGGSEAWQGATVDTVKAGDLDTPITGIATTFSATMDVLQRAVARGANLIVAHEPTFYDHLDETAWLGSDPVLEAKLEYVRKHKPGPRRFRGARDEGVRVLAQGLRPGSSR